MLDTPQNRIIRVEGTPREIGVTRGRALGDRLEQNIERYIRERPMRSDALSDSRLRTEAFPFLRSLPERFQEELEGLAEGAEISLHRVAEWIAVEKCVNDGCSGLVLSVNGNSWVGRNNDFRVPEAWGYVTIREVDGRIPTMTFGMEGYVFTATGINREQLWLHAQYLPAEDTPNPGKPHHPSYVILTEGLETCRSVSDFQTVLDATDRDEGVIFFAVDGKTNEVVIFECSCRDYTIRKPERGLLIATNHASSTRPDTISASSSGRFNRIKELCSDHDFRKELLPEAIKTIMADELVEQRQSDFVTVESFTACPAAKQVWYTLGGYPAASNGNWTRIDWPWQ